MIWRFFCNNYLHFLYLRRNILHMKNIVTATIALLLALSPGLLRAQSLHPQAPSVPDKMVFAGETIRLDRQDFRERLDRELIAFTNMHTNSTLMLKRSRRMFALIVPVLKEQGLPEDLKYLMAIESNLDPKAVSVTGASGLWQFTKATAGTYKLEVSAEVDERFNIEKETLAACAFLKDAYKKFGDWMTVAASYNAGQGGIAARLAEQKQTSALELWLKEETSRYMFRLMACKLFFEDPSDFGFQVEPEEMYPPLRYKETVTVTGPIPSLVDFALEHGVTFAALKEANLWLRDSHLSNKAGKTYKILIP